MPLRSSTNKPVSKDKARTVAETERFLPCPAGADDPRSVRDVARLFCYKKLNMPPGLPKIFKMFSLHKRCGVWRSICALKMALIKTGSMIFARIC